MIDAKNKNGDTPLHIAAKGSNINVLMCLIENGAIVTEKNIHGHTAIYYAAKNDRDDIVYYLTETKKNDDGKKEHAENEVIPNLGSTKMPKTVTTVAAKIITGSPGSPAKITIAGIFFTIFFKSIKLY